MGFLSSLSSGGGSFLGGAVGAVGSLIGGGINASNAREQMAMQREFAQNGIRWKVADAKAAGIHPLAALGAQTFSYNPVMTGDNGISEALGRMGQGVDRAAHAKALAEERVLDADLKKANINLVNAQTDAVQIQAAASKAALAKSAQVPSMPQVNSSTPAGILDKPIQAYGWMKDHKGRIMGVVPSEDMKDRTEDVLGIEWMPWATSGIRNFRAKVFGEPIDGMYWHGDNVGFKPYPPKKEKRKTFFENLRDVIDFYKR